MSTWAERTARVQRSAQRAFAEPVTYRFAWGGECSIKGIFTAAFEAVDTGGEGEVSSTAPWLGVVLADFPADSPPSLNEDEKTFDRIVLGDGTHYRVIDVQPDGHGGARLALHKD